MLDPEAGLGDSFLTNLDSSCSALAFMLVLPMTFPHPHV